MPRTIALLAGLALPILALGASAAEPPKAPDVPTDLPPRIEILQPTGIKWSYFLTNRSPGPNAYQKPENRGGLERTNDVVFSNDGKSMYVVDYGELYIDYSMPSPFFTTPRSGVIWKVTYTGQ